MTTHQKSGLTRRTLLATGAAAAAGALVSAPAIAQGRKKLRMAGINILCFSPMFLARDLGYFADEGLDVEIIETHGGSQTTSALLSGDAKVVTSNYASPIILAGEGMSTRHIVGLEMKNIYAFVVRPDLDIPQDDVKALVAGLKGKHLGVASLGSGADTVGSGFLAENGLPDGDFSRVAVGTGGTALAALAAGGVDAMVTFEPDLTQALRAGTGRIALDFRSTTIQSDFARLPSTTMQATSAWLAQEPETATHVVKAIARANRTLRDDPDTSVSALTKLYPTIDPAAIRAMYEGERTSFQSGISKEQFEIAQKIYLGIKVVKKPAAFEDVVATQFSQLWA